MRKHNSCDHTVVFCIIRTLLCADSVTHEYNANYNKDHIYTYLVSQQLVLLENTVSHC